MSTLRDFFYPYKIELIYRLNRRSFSRYRVLTIEETAERIAREGLSAARFGDGELRLIFGDDIGFEPADDTLRRRLGEIIRAQDEGFLVCLPDVFDSLGAYTKNARWVWRSSLGYLAQTVKELISVDRLYGNAFVSRPYMDYLDKELAAERFAKIKGIWAKRAVTIIEGEGSRLGVGNDLFTSATSIERILCPGKNAYAVYDEILTEARQIDCRRLVLIALGPTAKVLAYDLFNEGYQAVDIGHVDVEYEWFLQGAAGKTTIPGKAVNEVSGIDAAVEACGDTTYRGQIVARIGSACGE